jgi:hypothetical protein
VELDAEKHRERGSFIIVVNYKASVGCAVVPGRFTRRIYNRHTEDRCLALTHTPARKGRKLFSRDSASASKKCQAPWNPGFQPFEQVPCYIESNKLDYVKSLLDYNLTMIVRFG